MMDKFELPDHYQKMNIPDYLDNKKTRSFTIMPTTAISGLSSAFAVQQLDMIFQCCSCSPINLVLSAGSLTLSARSSDGEYDTLSYGPIPVITLSGN